MARRPGQAVWRPGRSVDAVRGADGGVLHADAGQDHEGLEGPGGFLEMAGKTTRVTMPQLGESVHEGTISKWLVQPGEKVVEFEPMLEVDTDKVNAEVPAPVSGVLKEILAKEGETVQAGAEIAVVELEGDGEASAKTPALAEEKGAAAEPTPKAAEKEDREAKPPPPAAAAKAKPAAAEPRT